MLKPRQLHKFLSPALLAGVVMISPTYQARLAWDPSPGQPDGYVLRLDKISAAASCGGCHVEQNNGPYNDFPVTSSAITLTGLERFLKPGELGRVRVRAVKGADNSSWSKDQVFFQIKKPDQ